MSYDDLGELHRFVKCEHVWVIPISITSANTDTTMDVTAELF